MATLIYSTLCSLDGFVADRDGNFDWAVPDEEVHAFINQRAEPIGTFLLGRRLYETLVAWETTPTEGEPPEIEDFARIWRAADKVVYSRKLTAPASSRTTIERDFDAAAVRRLKASASRVMAIGGPELAAQAIKAGLVDEYQLYLVPVIIGGGNPVLPGDIRLDLELLEDRRFANGMVYLRYRNR